ncbi:AraC family transcription regulator [Xenorhabdus mauleonii]|uniref:AraC family transcription regulator n=1 Tax=Xenorhabdus mauleonii TaxID=351675 RepID=A0A1I3M3A3_9GAMM|nr:helix-turn-helix domain-containing protein [Xenorhabdus mauleonii]PHM45381.1 AraC family transcription regulator [Xenorhabdus mauleonii]SFI91196.1 Helix-turn-helix domain-containing protein [Xenorhabdus mauleonii]
MNLKLFTMPDHLSLCGDILSAQRHRHDFMHLIVSLNDDPITIQINDENYQSTAFLLNSGVTHCIMLENQAYWLVLINHTSSLAACLRHQWLNDNLHFQDLSHHLRTLIPDAYNMFEQPQVNGDTYKQLWQKTVDRLGVSACYLPHEISDKRVDAIISTLQSTSKLPLHDDSLLANIYLSRSRLSHLFTDSTGSSLKSYFLFHRLITALLKIHQGDSVTQAALESGFDSPSHLSATSRRLMGISPRFAKQVSQFLKVFPT